MSLKFSKKYYLVDKESFARQSTVDRRSPPSTDLSMNPDLLLASQTRKRMERNISDPTKPLEDQLLHHAQNMREYLTQLRRSRQPQEEMMSHLVEIGKLAAKTRSSSPAPHRDEIAYESDREQSARTSPTERAVHRGYKKLRTYEDRTRTFSRDPSGKVARVTEEVDPVLLPMLTETEKRKKSSRSSGDRHRLHSLVQSSPPRTRAKKNRNRPDHRADTTLNKGWMV